MIKMKKSMVIMTNKRTKKYETKKTYKLTAILPKSYQKRTNYLKRRMKFTSKDKMVRELIDHKIASL